MARFRPGSHALASPLAVATVTLLGLALVLCLVHSDHDDGEMDMLHGACGVALAASFFAASIVLTSLDWWRLPSSRAAADSVPLHLPDPPPKSPAFL